MSRQLRALEDRVWSPANRTPPTGGPGWSTSRRRGAAGSAGCGRRGGRGTSVSSRSGTGRRSRNWRGCTVFRLWLAPLAEGPFPEQGEHGAGQLVRATDHEVVTVTAGSAALTTPTVSSREATGASSGVISLYFEVESSTYA